ncbi:MAG: YraN family protein [Microgenomates group bacterium]
MKKENYNKGKVGEDTAKRYLIDQGFSFIESNYDTDIGEIDLIMSDRDTLVFVEVKYKSDDRMGLPEEMINKRKIAQVRRVAELYLLKNSQMRRNFEKYRIDAVCILGRDIRYYGNIS